jgi:cystathionine beta-synthase
MRKAATVKPNNKGILDLVGNTPLVELGEISHGHGSKISVKLESFNPTGSIKDRVALHFIEDAESRGAINAGDVVVEATSGNTGTSLAMVTALKGYKCIIVLPETVSPEKVKAVRTFGAEVILTPSGLLREDERSYYYVAERIAEEHEGIYLNQYFNRINPEAHYRSTGPEIWRDTEGKVDAVVCGIGTGGTITGIGRYLKEKNHDIKIIGVEPVGSVFRGYLKRGIIEKASKFRIEGIGKNFIPGVIDFRYIDDVIQVSDSDSFCMVETLMRREGILAGGSGGAAVAGALIYAQQTKRKENIVTILPDTGLKYFSRLCGGISNQATFLRSVEG